MPGPVAIRQQTQTYLVSRDPSLSHAFFPSNCLPSPSPSSCSPPPVMPSMVFIPSELVPGAVRRCILVLGIEMDIDVHNRIAVSIGNAHAHMFSSFHHYHPFYSSLFACFHSHIVSRLTRKFKANSIYLPSQQMRPLLGILFLATTEDGIQRAAGDD